MPIRDLRVSSFNKREKSVGLIAVIWERATTSGAQSNTNSDIARCSTSSLDPGAVDAIRGM